MIHRAAEQDLKEVPTIGYARCVKAAMTQELLKGSDRVILHFLSDILASQRMYEGMGFLQFPEFQTDLDIFV